MLENIVRLMPFFLTTFLLAGCAGTDTGKGATGGEGATLESAAADQTCIEPQIPVSKTITNPATDSACSPLVTLQVPATTPSAAYSAPSVPKPSTAAQNSVPPAPAQQGIGTGEHHDSPATTHAGTTRSGNGQAASAQTTAGHVPNGAIGKDGLPQSREEEPAVNASAAGGSGGSDGDVSSSDSSLPVNDSVEAANTNQPGSPLKRYYLRNRPKEKKK